ncbi:uncharacterized protein Dana_GF10435, isoform C [Drosophila ananassae]|uniref:Uncharacterized protein, isoform C n=1 Tax=Drosophila ananassae TaxID=7217 RepID=A0A0P9C452_DROAN|nr:carcinine transporter isoform X4 [Drosophila ananassae]KPU78489.1 uncharacterized protein Dana_GF10435, isoform C [Drosophila ananassae]
MSNNESRKGSDEDEEDENENESENEKKKKEKKGKPRFSPSPIRPDQSDDEEVNVTYADPDDVQDMFTRRSWWQSPPDMLPSSSWDGPDYFDFDDLLPIIGEFGRFQLVLFLFMIPFGYIAAYVYLGQIFMTLTPHKYYCFVPQLTLVQGEDLRKKLSIPLESDGSFSRCRMFDRNYTNMHAKVANNTHDVDETLPTIPCQYGYVYEDKEMRFHSATMEFGWVCDNDKYATYAQFIFFVGSILGCVSYAYLADHVGRLNVLVSSCFLAMLGSLATAASSNFYAFAFCRLIVGASYDSLFTMVFILVHEYVGPKYRSLVAFISLALFYCPFTLLIPWMALWTGDWRRFAVWGCMPIILGMAAYWLLPESARRFPIAAGWCRGTTLKRP